MNVIVRPAGFDLLLASFRRDYILLTCIATPVRTVTDAAVARRNGERDDALVIMNSLQNEPIEDALQKAHATVHRFG